MSRAAGGRLAARPRGRADPRAVAAGGVDHPGRTADTLVFPTGSFKVAHSKPTGTQTLNPKTCLVTATQTGTYTINGTGSYTGITGHGTYQATVLAIAARNAQSKCSATLPPAAWQQVIKPPGQSTCNSRRPLRHRCGTGQARACTHRSRPPHREAGPARRRRANRGQTLAAPSRQPPAADRERAADSHPPATANRVTATGGMFRLVALGDPHIWVG
jgi:hypothetical protein